MPYVEVWVDDCDLSCEGDCDHNERSQDAIKSALKLLRDGCQKEAIMALSEVCDPRNNQHEINREREFSELFHGWNSTYGPRQDFFTYAHKRRKHTRG